MCHVYMAMTVISCGLINQSLHFSNLCCTDLRYSTCSDIQISTFSCEPSVV